MTKEQMGMLIAYQSVKEEITTIKAEVKRSTGKNPKFFFSA